MKPRLLELISAEAKRAKNGEPASITAKVNSLQDEEIIKALYQASKDGVKIKLNIRGICCLKTATGSRGRKEAKHRSSLRYRSIPRARPDLLVPPRWQSTVIHFLGRLDDTQSRQTCRADDSHRGQNLPQAPPYDP